MLRLATAISVDLFHPKVEELRAEFALKYLILKEKFVCFYIPSRPELVSRACVLLF